MIKGHRACLSPSHCADCHELVLCGISFYSYLITSIKITVLPLILGAQRLSIHEAAGIVCPNRQNDPWA